LNKYPHPYLAKEGWPFIFFAFILIIVFSYFGFFWSIPFWIITLFVVQFFRDPPRLVPVEKKAILSPADGRVILVSKEQDPYLNRETIKISIFMNVFNVHSNRIPIDGKVEKIEYFPGKFFNADLDKASLQNERNVVIISTVNDMKITCVQVAGLIARRILCYIQKGDKVERGQRYGFIRFGSRVDIYLPVNTQIKVCVGDKVLASESIIAEH
tara:strand:- start:463 stop:1101 length:639 start_codon:yes stop_codon:yes gene_type:complete